MLPAFSESFYVLPELRVLPETPLYDVWSKHEGGWVILRKDGKLFRNRFLRVSRWTKYQRAFLKRVTYMGSREPWINLVRGAAADHVINGYEVVDLTILEFTIPEIIAEQRKIPALKFREFVEK